MKRLPIIILILALLVMPGCQTAQEQNASVSQNQEEPPAPSVPTPTPETDVSSIADRITHFSGGTKTISVQEGVLTMDIPADFDDPFDLPGSLYISTGTLKNSEGEESVFQFTVNHVFQAEDPLMDYEMFDNLVETMVIWNLSLDYTFERIKDVTINKTAQGFITHYAFKGGDTDYDQFDFFIGSNGVYYKIQFIGPQGFFDLSEVVALFDTLEIDAEKEANWVNQYKVKYDNIHYYSPILEGAKVNINPAYTYTETYRLIYPNTILSVTLNSNSGFLVIRSFPIKIYQNTSFEDFVQFIVANVINRGFFESDDPDADIVQHLTDDGHIYFYYPNDKETFILHYPFAYEDAYYVCEIVYSGDDLDELLVLQRCAESFVAPGKEVTPLFTPEDSDR